MGRSAPRVDLSSPRGCPGVPETQGSGVPSGPRKCSVHTLIFGRSPTGGTTATLTVQALTDISSGCYATCLRMTVTKTRGAARTARHRKTHRLVQTWVSPELRRALVVRAKGEGRSGCHPSPPLRRAGFKPSERRLMALFLTAHAPFVATQSLLRGPYNSGEFPAHKVRECLGWEDGSSHEQDQSQRSA
jgi:hypothetical protein